MNHHNMFFNMLTPYFQLLKKWGVLALFGKIGYGVLLCKRHKLKNIYEISYRIGTSLSRLRKVSWITLISPFKTLDKSYTCPKPQK